MTESFVTQCPHCQTSFRVSYHQLSAARGAVRCGSCLQVFNAARQLLEKSTGKSAAALFPETPSPASDDAAAPLPLPTLPAAPASVETPNRRVEPISQRRWAAAAEIDLEHLDLDDELARLEHRFTPRHGNPDAAAREDQLSASRDEPEAAQHDFEDEGHRLTEPRFAAHLDDQHARGQQSPLSQHDHHGLRAERDSEPAAYHYLPGDAHTPAPLMDDHVPPVVHEQVEDDARTEPPLTRLEDEFDEHERRAPLHDRRQRRSAIEAADESLRRVDAAPLKAAAKARRAEPRMRDADLPDLSEDPLELQWEKSRSSWGKRLLWSALALLAALTLAGQYVAYHFDELARQDAYRPWFQQFCPVVGCEVPSKVDIALIKSSNLVVRSHPQFNGALIVDAIIYNRAPFSQPFPLLELRFADLDGKLIASRRFKPSEYLSGDLAGQSDMPPQTPIHIALDILDPGSKAVNYSLSFQSPE